MRNITVEVSDRDFESITKIGLTPWTKTTESEKKEYDRLISLYGTAVALKVCQNEGAFNHASDKLPSGA